MKHKIFPCLALVLSGVLFGCSTTVESHREYLVTHDPAERPDILSYSKPSAESLKKIKIERVFLTGEQSAKMIMLPKSETRFHTRSLGCSTAVENANSNAPNHLSDLPIRYHNAKYGFTFFLPASWKGYSVLIQQWESELRSADYQTVIGMEHGPMIVLRNPQWKASEPNQDIPIVVFTRSQWELEIKERINIGAGGSEKEIAHNAKYVFAISTRFDWGELKGFQEAGRIVDYNQAANEPHLPDKPEK